MQTLPAEDGRLVLISGPVASGKTTLAFRLAELARARGLPAGSIDIDELVGIVAGRDWSLVTDTHRELACKLAAGVAQQLFDSGSRLVAIAGSTLSPHEWQQVVQHLDSAPPTTYVLLRVSVAAAQSRAQGDPSRIATRDLGVVERLHASIDWTKIRQPDIEIDTDGMGAEEVATVVGRVILTTT